MTNLLDLITPYENGMIEYLRRIYSRDYKENRPFASNESFLTYWSRIKSENRLIRKIFSDELRVTKEIQIKKPLMELQEELSPLLNLESEDYEFFPNFIKGMINLVSKYDEIEAIEPKIARTFFINSVVTSFDFLNDYIQNRYEGHITKIAFKDGLTLNFPKGAKLLKLLKNTCETLADSPYDDKGHFKKALAAYEDFRLAHSRILNQKMFKGKLTLSIHPLDYMTMSDNNCGWKTCMSWEDYGEFRLGTLEMMNSPYAIVAYLESSSKDYYLDEDTENLKWTNKKWRELILVHPEMITGIKGYPYHDAALEKEALKFVNELLGDYFPHEGKFNANDACITFTDRSGGGPFSFYTDRMYNDLSDTAIQVQTITVYTSDAYYNFPKILTSISYSGAAHCIWCGEVLSDDIDSASLQCDECLAVTYCSICGKPITSEVIATYTLGSTLEQAICFDCQVDLPNDIITGAPIAPDRGYITLYLEENEGDSKEPKEEKDVRIAYLYLEDDTQKSLEAAILQLSLATNLFRKEIRNRLVRNEETNELSVVLSDSEIQQKYKYRFKQLIISA